jgi:hypothetical protein
MTIAWLDSTDLFTAGQKLDKIDHAGAALYRRRAGRDGILGDTADLIVLPVLAVAAERLNQSISVHLFG